jgi:hypothetical protein
MISSDSLQDIESFNYSSSSLFAANPPNPNASTPSSIRFLAGYNFTLSIVKGYAALWEIEAVVGFDFISAGSIGVVLQMHDQDYSDGPVDEACYFNPSCIYGHGRLYDEDSIRTKIGPGLYKGLWYLFTFF